MEKNLVLIGWGRPEYPAAGAAALDGLRGHADVFGTSRSKLSQALSDRAMNYDATYVIGVGITKNLRETVEALKRLREAGKKVYWISRMNLEEAEPMLREEFGSSLGFAEVFVRKQDNNLVAVVGNYFKDEAAQKYYKFCTPVVKKEERSETNVVAVFQRLFRAAGYYHREIHDDGLYGKVVKKLWETQKLEVLREDKALMKQLEFFDKYGDDEIVGDHPTTKALIERIVKIAPCDSANVLILGETGTGKELIAKQIHRRSPRASGPLVVDNCACMDGDLINTRLFGHEKGAFTDAKEMHRGLIEQANGGTLFLDEIGELPLEAQAKLLRALDSHKVAREGGDIANQIDVDFRLVAATNRDLVRRVAEGKFREDLLQRIATVIIHTTPLRERREDIVKIAKYRWPKITRRPEAKLSRAQNEALMSYDYPGNVRELNNLLERANALGEEDFSVLIAEQSDMMRVLVEARKQAAPPASEPSVGEEPSFAALPEKRDELLRLHARYLYGKYRKFNVAAEKAGVTINTFKGYFGKSE